MMQTTTNNTMDDRIRLQEKALLLMYKLGEVAPKYHTIKLYDYKGDCVGEKEIFRLKSTGKDNKIPNEKLKRTMIPQMEIKQGFD